MSSADPSQGLPARYREVRAVAAGGFGVILRAVDDELGRPVAIKRLHAAAAEDAEVAARFLREARRTAAVKHPHLIEVLDFGHDEAGGPYLVYEWVDGHDLASARAPLSPGDVQRVGVAVAEALHALHQAGITHRDVKPSNVLLRDGQEPLLADLGIARVSGGATVQTAEGVLLGTPAFMAPELWAGEDAGPASDQFAWAASLVVAAGGPLPWRADSPAEILARLRHPTPIAIPSAVLAGAPGLRAVLSRALARDPADRFPDLAAFAAALRAPPAAPPAAPTREVAPAAPPRPPPGPPPSGRARLVLPGLVLLAVAAGFGVGGLGDRGRQAPPAPPPEAPRPAAVPAMQARIADLRAAASDWRARFPYKDHQARGITDALAGDVTLPGAHRRLMAAGYELISATPPGLAILPTGPGKPAWVALMADLVDPLNHFLNGVKWLREDSHNFTLSTDGLLTIRELERLREENAPMIRRTERFLADLLTIKDRHPVLVAYLVGTLGSRFHPRSFSDVALYLPPTSRHPYLAALADAFAVADTPRARVALCRAAYKLMANIRPFEGVETDLWDQLLEARRALVSAGLPPRFRDVQYQMALDLARDTVQGPAMFAALSPASPAAFDAALGRLAEDAEVAQRHRGTLVAWVRSQRARYRSTMSPGARRLVERALALAE